MKDPPLTSNPDRSGAEWFKIGKFTAEFAETTTFFVCLLLILFYISGCSPKSQFVLLPDPDGHVGKLEVSNPKGQSILEKPWQSTEVKSLAYAPGEPRIMDEEQVRHIFKEALAAQPNPPAIFLMYFKSESSIPTSKSLESLPKIMDEIQSRKTKDISVVGHTDCMGTVDYNLNLSLKRAKRVAEILAAEGVDPSIIEIDYFGKEKPLIETPDGMPEPRNRRVEITIR